MRQIENLPTQSGDKPAKDAVIADCGELTGDDIPADAPKAPDALGDAYEDYPEDEADGDKELSAERVLKIATDCKDFGNKAFKAGEFERALDKYSKGLRYLNEDPDLDAAPEGTKAKMDAVRFTLNSNSALMNIKLQHWGDARAAACNALEVAGITDAERAKALYRRALTSIQMKDEDEALNDLEEANKLVPGDAAITKELTAVKSAAAKRRQKEKAAYSKFFS